MFSLTADRLIMGVIVLVAVVWAVRSVYRAFQAKSVCPDCSSSGECPLANNPEALSQLSHSGKMGKLDYCQSSPPDCHSLLASLEAGEEDETP